MEIFITLLLKIIPLYILIFLGFLSVRVLQIEKESIVKLLIYMIAPIVIFLGTYSVDITLAILSLPLLFFCISCLVSLIFLVIGTVVYGKERALKNILAFTAGTGNTGYFGLPVVYALFGEEMFSLAVLSILGFVLYENTLGFFLVANGKFSLKHSIYKVMKLPTIYAFVLGIVLNISSVGVSQSLMGTLENFKGAYVVFGMMIIGMGIGNIKKLSCDYLFTLLSLLAKFVIFPLLVLLVITMDKNLFHFLSNEIYSIMIIMAIVPLAANTVALAVEFQVHPEKVTITVLLSTIIALFYIPLIVSIFL